MPISQRNGWHSSAAHQGARPAAHAAQFDASPPPPAPRPARWAAAEAEAPSRKRQVVCYPGHHAEAHLIVRMPVPMRNTRIQMSGLFLRRYVVRVMSAERGAPPSRA